MSSTGHSSAQNKSVNRVISDSDTLLAALQTYNEHDLTVNVLIPLLCALGYEKIDYNCGPQEHGRDIIAWRHDEWGEQEVAVAQVKHYRPTSRARDSNSFSEIVTQLSQAAEKPIPTLDGPMYPATVFFFTPFPVDTRAIQTRFEGYEALRHRRIRTIDGPKLANLIKRHLPAVYRSLVGPAIQLSQRMQELLTNDPLMGALGATRRREIQEFYTDIDFVVGTWTTRLFFLADDKPSRKQLALSAEEWNELQSIDGFCLARLGIPIIQDRRDTVQANFEHELTGYETCQNEIKTLMEKQRALAHRIAQLDERLLNCLHLLRGLQGPAAREVHQLGQRLRERSPSIAGDDNLSRSPHSEPPSFEDSSPPVDALLHYVGAVLQYGDTIASERFKRGVIDTFFKDNEKRVNALESYFCNEIPDARAMAHEYVTCLDGQREVSRALAELRDKMPGPPHYRPTIEGAPLAKALEERRRWVQDMVGRFNAEHPRTEEIQPFLTAIRQLFSDTQQILSNAHVAEAVGIRPGTNLVRDSGAYRLRLHVEEVFDSRLNILLLGEAGAGKTTALQMYARRRLETQNEGDFCLFIPLGRMVNAWRHARQADVSEGGLNLEGMIAAYLTEVGECVSETELIELLRNKTPVLLLDGIDEGAKAAPWLGNAITALADKYDKLQVIASSRLSSPAIERVPFIPVTLLPFTEEQQRRFIDNWFVRGGSGLPTNVKQHLRDHAEVRRVVTSPLLATVLCVLAEFNIDLPDTEVRLFEERMKLLTGHYDLHKRIGRRIESMPNDLSFVARKIAFWLHNSESREANRGEIEKFVTDLARNRMDAERCRLAVGELVDPCNVLVPMTDDGKVGFGHLRYQEHLAAEEICRNRAIEIEPLLSHVWWREVLVLFAKAGDASEWLRKFLTERKGQVMAEQWATVWAMICGLPSELSAELRSLVQQDALTAFSHPFEAYVSSEYEPSRYEGWYRLGEHGNDGASGPPNCDKGGHSAPGGIWKRWRKQSK